MTAIIHPYLRPRPKGTKQDKKPTLIENMSIKRALSARSHVKVTLPTLKFMEGKEK